MNAEYITTAEFARRRGLAASTVRKWCADGEKIDGVMEIWQTPRGHYRLLVLCTEPGGAEASA